MKNKIRRTAFVILFCLTGISLNGCNRDNIYNEENKSAKEDIGIFSWKGEFVQKASEKDFKKLFEAGITQIYQGFSGSAEAGDIKAFIESASVNNIGVYYLSGSPKWGLEDDAKSCIREIERAYELNKELETGKIKGIVLDVEPYLTDDWGEDKEEVMSLFTENMARAYEASRGLDFELILCIPYYYDTEGFEKELEILIGECCDKIAVMNYYRDNESKHIETELSFAEKYEKQLINIYELKEPGEHGLTDKNTYYNYGMESVYDSFEEIKTYFGDSSIAMALHDIEAFYEVAY